jgi:hypothetical protein
VRSNWASELARFASDCETASSGEAGQMVLRLYDLLAQEPLQPWVAGIARNELVRRCEAGCADDAALGLVANCGIMLSQAPQGLAIATVLRPGSDTESTASSRSIALAFCEALAVAVGETIPTEVEVRSDPSSRDRS